MDEVKTTMEELPGDIRSAVSNITVKTESADKGDSDKVSKTGASKDTNAPDGKPLTKNKDNVIDTLDELVEALGKCINKAGSNWSLRTT